MINAASNPRDKALVALLYDSGMQVWELPVTYDKYKLTWRIDQLEPLWSNGN